MLTPRMEVSKSANSTDMDVEFPTVIEEELDDSDKVGDGFVGSSSSQPVRINPVNKMSIMFFFNIFSLLT
tara:strand:- start:425 stop:634 length:210 start_codon:yes stop_codon:yes gene_type:complete